MTKLSLDIESFKALASEKRLDILRILDGKKMNLSDICHNTKMNKMTLHDHLNKLTQVGLIKRIEREGHKWVYYKLSWKGESLLHPENTNIVLLFSIAFSILFFGIISLVNFIRNQIPEPESGLLTSPNPTTSPSLEYLAIVCFILFIILCSISIWKYSKNKTPQL
jgi:DNA-binding transcriptional ArsR family regulator